MPWSPLPPGPALEAYDDLAARQDGVLSRAQLRGLGVDRRAVARAASAARWRPLGPDAVVLHTGPLTARQRWWAALMCVGPRSVLVGPTAAAAWGLHGYECETVHVGVPRGAVPRAVPRAVAAEHSLEVRVHELRRLGPGEIHPALVPPRTRVAPSVRDCALWAPDADRAVAVVAAAVQQRLVLVPHVREAMRAVRRHRHRRPILWALGDIEGGAHSLAELDAVRLCRRAGLPPPQQQRRRQDSAGRTRWLDLDWEEYALTVEIDGGLHLLAGSWWADMSRQNDLVITGGRMVLRFPALLPRLHPDRFVTEIRRALMSRGWKG